MCFHYPPPTSFFTSPLTVNPELTGESFALVTELSAAVGAVGGSSIGGPLMSEEPVSKPVVIVTSESVRDIQPRDSAPQVFSPSSLTKSAGVNSQESGEVKKKERRDVGGRIMNTTHKPNPSISRNEAKWREGSGRNQNGRDLTYGPNTPPSSTGSYSCAHGRSKYNVINRSSPHTSQNNLSTSSGDLSQLQPAVLALSHGKARGSSSAR